MKITVIPQSKKMFSSESLKSNSKRKVAAYARVSTDSDEQHNSYEAQIEYYRSFITAHEDWEFVGIYTDEGISGTSTARRAGFNQMVSDALAGKIDLIVTKSVSRFARNTVDSLTIIRQLRENGVEVYFEKEAIWTFDSKGELLITIMSSLAQEESRSISENITWGKRKRFADGQVSVGYSKFLGYNRGEEGGLVVDEKGAEIVRLIYRLYMQGMSAVAVADYLTELGIPTPSGKETWQASVVHSILSNEKYRGDALLQKQFTIDFLKKKMKVNEGEVPRYYVHESHEAIIDPVEFELVQAEITGRKKAGKWYRYKQLFAGKLVCGNCGTYFGSKVWHSTDKYRQKMWQCNNRFKKGSACRMPALSDTEVKAMFAAACAQYAADHPQIAADRKALLQLLGDGKEIGRQIKELEGSLREYDILLEADAPVISPGRTKKLKAQRNQAKAQLESLQTEQRSVKGRKRKIKAALDTLIEQSYSEERLTRTILDQAIVQADKSVTFVFRDGYTCTVDYKSI